MPYFMEFESGEIEKVEADFVLGQTEVPADIKAVYMVGRTFTMKRTLLPDGGKVPGPPRRYNLPDGTKKLRSEMTAAELEWLNSKLKKAREAKGKAE
jgi:hypothetical protein